MRGAARRDSDQAIAQWLGTCTDIDDRKRAAQEIERLNGSLEQRVTQRTAELAEANRDLRQKNQENEMFVYSVSHDLRSPLVNLQGFSKELDLAASELSELMWEDSIPQRTRQQALALLDGDLRESIRFIQTGVMRLSGIIDALLRLSRVGRIEYHFENVDMNALANRIVESMGATLYDKGVNIKVHNLSPCHGDVTAIEQLFANLIGNAVKYLDSQRPGMIEIGQAADEGPERIYFVSDNGLGIPLAYHEKVFDSFKRFHPHAAPGDGMGLAIVRRIAERHGGEVRVESQEGRGSTFFVTLPGNQSTDTYHGTKEGDRNAIRVDGHFVS
jgi:signal transduction histidine kinase